MMKRNLPVFGFALHDPSGRFNMLFTKTFSALQHNFSKICIGVTPETIKNNREFIDKLKKMGCHTYINQANTSIGDHFRSALHLAAKESENASIYFGFIDRTIYALNSKYRNQFEKDILRQPKNLILFERTERAWATHPKKYFMAENSANILGSLLLGKKLELATCGFLITSNLAKKILKHSHADSFSAGAEWILLAHLLDQKPQIIKGDWLSWEDPIFENISTSKLKKEREQSRREIIKRLEMNIQIAQILIEPRFYPLIKNKKILN